MLVSKKKNIPGTSLMVQWLRLHLPVQGGKGLIPGPRTKVPQTMGYNQKFKKKKEKYSKLSFLSYSVFSFHRKGKHN